MFGHARRVCAPLAAKRAALNFGSARRLAASSHQHQSHKQSSSSSSSRNALFTASAVGSAALLFSASSFSDDRQQRRRPAYAEVPAAHFSKPGVAVGQGMAEDLGVDGCTAGFKPLKPPEGKGADHDFPTISLDEVRSAGDKPGKPVWVTFEGGVYDVTSFADSHPGGPARVQMVSGQDLSAFWKVYPLHTQRAHILELLEKYRIGTLSSSDAVRARKESTFHDSYEAEEVLPARSYRSRARYRVASEHPWNSEPRSPKFLIESFYTPNDMFFVRNHNPVPMIDEADWELEIVGNEALGLESRSFTLADLKTKFPRHEVSAVIQCAGNRQEDFVTADRALYVAPHWTNQAIGNAKWAGVRVRDVLKACGLDVDGLALNTASISQAKWVNFSGEDTDEAGTPYASSLPIEKIVDGWGDCILAYEMNGETLPHDHGFPIRLLAPGHAGCRNTKWVSQIDITAEKSVHDSGSRLDRHFAPDVSFLKHLRHGDHMVRLDQGPVLQTLPVTSIICEPVETVKTPVDGYVTVGGVAYAGAGRGVSRVEVSIDGGRNFTAAEVYRGPSQMSTGGLNQRIGTYWEWVHFQQHVPLSPAMKAKLADGEELELHVVSRAIDGDFNTQPEKMEQCWNVLGICVNHWARVKATVYKPFHGEDETTREA